jgi:3-deoxy-manno-octulosonate cytidylyltransferase (CMP-KDO synthetase)
LSAEAPAAAAFRVVIPARYAATRLPGKLLLPLGGKPVIQWVYERACAAGAQQVLIATDDDLIVSAAHSFGAEAIMTAATHASGTDRIAELARSRGWDTTDIVVNVQGDEPLMPPALIRQVAQLLASHPRAALATLASPLRTLREFLDPNIVKLVAAPDGRALYFSRAPIPWSRDGASAGLASQRELPRAQRHLGIYAYRVGPLLQLAALPVSALERIEKLEQLRALEAGLEIRVAEAQQPPGPDVNTPADLERVREQLARGDT